jgi:hypothetical protein
MPARADQLATSTRCKLFTNLFPCPPRADPREQFWKQLTSGPLSHGGKRNHPSTCFVDVELRRSSSHYWEDRSVPEIIMGPVLTI